jgi:putative SOS response-associated peptidase YedK
MCGRAYSTYTEDELYARYQNERTKRNPLGLKPNFNMAPTHQVPVVRSVDGVKQLDLFHWQFIPPYEPEFKTKLSTINAKSETVFSSRLYGRSILERRCIVPISGFFEWKAVEGAVKRPFCVHLKNEHIMSVAGIWSPWGPPGQERYSFALMTTEPNAVMAEIHNRMPVILSRESEAAWLDPARKDRAEIEAMLKPCPDDWLETYQVSTLVNSPRNNVPEILKPV